MNSGRLCHWVEIQRVSRTPDGKGGFTETWTTIPGGARWSEVRPITNPERYSAYQLQGVSAHEVKTPWWPGCDVANGDRVLFGTRVLTVQGRVNWGERNVELAIVCIEGMVES